MKRSIVALSVALLMGCDEARHAKAFRAFDPSDPDSVAVRWLELQWILDHELAVIGSAEAAALSTLGERDPIEGPGERHYAYPLGPGEEFDVWCIDGCIEGMGRVSAGH